MKETLTTESGGVVESNAESKSEKKNERLEATLSTAGVFFAQELLGAISDGYIDLAEAERTLKNVAGQARSMIEANTDFETLGLIIQSALENFPTTPEGNKTSEHNTPAFYPGKHPFVGMNHNFWADIKQGPQTTEALMVALERAQALVGFCAKDAKGVEDQAKKASQVLGVLGILNAR